MRAGKCQACVLIKTDKTEHIYLSVYSLRISSLNLKYSLSNTFHCCSYSLTPASFHRSCRARPVRPIADDVHVRFPVYTDLKDPYFKPKHFMV